MAQLSFLTFLLTWRFLIVQLLANTDENLILYCDFTDASLVCKGSESTLKNQGGAVPCPDRCGKIDASFCFAGNQTLWLSNSPHPKSPHDKYTYTAWVRANGNTTNPYGTIISAGTHEIAKMSSFMVHPANHFGYDYTLSFDGFNTMWASDYHLSTDVWIHVAVTREINTISLSVNGQQVSVGQLNQWEITIEDTAFYIGSIFQKNTWWEGAIDDVRVYDDVLSVDRIREIYNQEVCKVEGKAMEESTFDSKNVTEKGDGPLEQVKSIVDYDSDSDDVNEKVTALIWMMVSSSSIFCLSLIVVCVRLRAEIFCKSGKAESKSTQTNDTEMEKLARRV
eukprot:CAMPEP_0115006168 /NCGR_PEP_ID=MMETSP0216-20121206/20326_1 /TAXON_ID=223996 /ORGANISM="Protocruzia adherens, Strain Boccale" /LENGTH=336 /DNA_ID=CAMNT_0002372673 /DNA_START=27 /DNA_END=1037 /DNA_ORIENTATION=+